MLNSKLDNYVEYKGGRVKLTLPFNNVLNFYNLQEDERFNDEEKINLGFGLLTSTSKKYSYEEKIEIIKEIFDQHINLIKLKGNKTNVKSFDFNQDSGYIYASFMDQYNIDLNDCIDSLDWRKFLWLFHGLSEKTIIKKIMSIRTKPIPKRTKNNHDEITNIMELKMMYALDTTTEEKEKSFADSLKQLAKRYV